MRANTPSVTTSMRVLRLTFEPSRTRKPTVSPTVLAERARHAVGGGAGREPARLEQDELARPPTHGSSSSAKRHPRRLAGAGRGDEHARSAAPSAVARSGRAASIGSGVSKARIAGDNAGAVERRKRLRWGVLAIRDLIFSGARTVCGENNTG